VKTGIRIRIIVFRPGTLLFKIIIVADPDPGSDIRCLFHPWIRDPGWIKKSGSRSGMNNPDHISESLDTIFRVKILDIFDADPGWK
jgi:hypothetical protein